MKFCNCDYCYLLENCDPDDVTRENSPLCVSYFPSPDNFSDSDLRLLIDNLQLNLNIYSNLLRKKVLLDD